MSAAGLALIVGRVVSGYLMDKIFAAYIVCFFLLCPMVGIALLLSRLGGAAPLLGVALLGVGIGAEFDLIAYIISRYYGLRAFGVMHGLMVAFAALANAVGNNLMGWCYQLRHSYTPALVIMEVLLLFAMIVQATMGPYRYAMVKPAKAPKPEELAAAH
jgi:MFS family permease